MSSSWAGFPYSVILLGSSIVGKLAADVDIAISKFTKVRDWDLVHAMKDSLYRILKQRNEAEHGAHILFDFDPGIEAIRVSVNKYGHSYRISAKQIFEITTASKAA